MAGNYKLQISLNDSLPYCYMRIKTKTIFKYVLCLPYKSPSTTDVCYFFSLSKMNSWVTAISSRLVVDVLCGMKTTISVSFFE